MGTLYLVDASVYVFRAWHSMPDSFVSPDGHPTHAVYGYAGFLLTLLERARPRHIAVAFDESLTTSYRNEIYPNYKANREPAPEELKRQFQWCREITAGLGLAWYADPRFEADDLIGTLAAAHRPDGCRVSFVSSDKDLAQLLEPGDELWDFARDRRTDYHGVHERFGVRAEQMADFLALTGDPIDNIPGLPGVGPKTAGALRSHFGTLDAVLPCAAEIAYLSLF
jgi:5'-3' exonuclease